MLPDFIDPEFALRGLNLQTCSRYISDPSLLEVLVLIYTSCQDFDTSQQKVVSPTFLSILKTL